MKKFETEVRLNREMSLMDVTLIGVGAMIVGKRFMEKHCTFAGVRNLIQHLLE